MKSEKTIILGGGLTGISLAYHLKQKHNYQLLERESRLGGLCRTDMINGFYFDKTGHWLHLRNRYTRTLVKRLLGDELITVERKSRIYSKGVYTPYPFQAHTYGLPSAVVKECLLGFIEAKFGKNPKEKEPDNFEDWIYHHFGKGIAKHFMIPYNKKLFGIHPRYITSVWCDRFVPKPTLEEVVNGAVGDNEGKLGYNVRFVYPKHGGIETLIKALSVDLPSINLNLSPKRIDYKKKELILTNGTKAAYQNLVSTIPLPELLKLMPSIPLSVKEAAKKLKSASVFYFNLGLTHHVDHDYHWLYIPEEKYPYYRIGFFSHAVPSLAPPNKSSLYVEVSHRRPIKSEQLIPKVYQGLMEKGIIRSREDILVEDIQDIKYGYVIFDNNYYSSTSTIFSFLSEHEIYPAGRYGAWKYAAMEDAILEGKRLAEQIQNRK
ncbi:MAG: FAD-dependent oxidoreductase [bacterium]